MKRIFDAKKKYEEIEIPSELKERVSAAIAQSTPKKRSPLFYAKILAPVAVCAAICIAVGVNGTVHEVPVEADTEISLARAMPEAADMAKAETAPSENEVMEDATGWYLSYDEYITEDTKGGKLPLKQPIKMTFASGAAAWGTTIELNADGSFVGDYGDSNAGEIGEGYPNGTHYTCSPFKGKFDNIKKVGDYAYSMTLTALEYDKTAPLEYIEEGIRMVKTEPLGIVDGEEFVFYLPDAPASVLTEEERHWWLCGYYEEEIETLTTCGLINKNTSHGFFSDPFKDR